GGDLRDSHSELLERLHTQSPAVEQSVCPKRAAKQLTPSGWRGEGSNTACELFPYISDSNGLQKVRSVAQAFIIIMNSWNRHGNCMASRLRSESGKRIQGQILGNSCTPGRSFL